MSDPGLQRLAEGEYRLTGPVSFATAGDLLAASEQLFAGQRALCVDLAGVSGVDSAGLALLLEWIRRSQAAGRRISFAAVPDRLRAVAQLTGVDELLGDYLR